MHASRSARALVAAATAVVVGALPAVASADVNPLRWTITPTGAAPLTSGFIEVGRAEGPTVYSHELAVLNGAARSTTFTLTRHFYVRAPACDGSIVFASDVARLTTNVVGAATKDFLVGPEEAAGFAGVHGVRWTLQTPSGAVVYGTACKAVTLD